MKKGAQWPPKQLSSWQYGRGFIENPRSKVHMQEGTWRGEEHLQLCAVLAGAWYPVWPNLHVAAPTPSQVQCKHFQTTIFCR